MYAHILYFAVKPKLSRRIRIFATQPKIANLQREVVVEQAIPSSQVSVDDVLCREVLHPTRRVTGKT